MAPEDADHIGGAGGMIGRVAPFVALAIILVLAVALTVSRRPTPDDAEGLAHGNVEPEALPTLWPVPAFHFTDSEGQTVTEASFQGRVTIVNFIFTTCRTVCPLLTAKLVQLQRLLGDTPVHFVSFSVDPANDTPQALKAYAAQWKGDPSRWTLLATDPAGLDRVAKGFHITAQAIEGGVDPVLHTALFLLVDAKGMVRGAFSSEDRRDFEALTRAARVLAGQQQPARPAALSLEGDALYHQLSCDGCHERPELAPPLGGRVGRRRELATGLTAVFDAAYVRESIVAPQAKVVRGYTLQMPAYDGLLDAARLEALAQYVLARPPPEVDEVGDAGVATCPVCGMKVRVVPGSLEATVDGGTSYFCSGYCRDRFLGGAAQRH